MNIHNTNSMHVGLLIRLINFYLETVNSFSTKLLEFLKVEDLTDWRSLNIPIRGDFSEGWSYAFHGSGCRISSPGLEVDFEFDTTCKVGGFDLWRLWSFICDNEDACAEFKVFQDKEKLRQVFNEAVLDNLITPMNEYEENGLYHLI